MANFNVSTPQEDLSKIDNSELVNAIDEMRKEYNDTTRDAVVNAAVFSTTFFAPAIFDKSTELVQNDRQRLEFTERPKAQFVLIENPKGEKYLPVFTSTELLKAFRERDEQAKISQSFVMSFADAASVVETFPFIEGFVINPFDQNLPFTKEFIQAIRKNLVEQMEFLKKQQGEDESDASKPDITMTTSEN